jgi:hypothetical protein
MAKRLGIACLSLIFGMAGLVAPAGVCQTLSEAKLESRATFLHRAVGFYGAPVVARALNARVSEVTLKHPIPGILARVNTKATARGDVATGVVIHEAKDGSELDLDANPCQLEVEVFHKPYEKIVLSETVKCGDKTYQKTQVEQR